MLPGSTVGAVEAGIASGHERGEHTAYHHGEDDAGKHPHGEAIAENFTASFFTWGYLSALHTQASKMPGMPTKRR